MQQRLGDDLIIFVAKGRSDIAKWISIAEKVGEQIPGSRFLIVTSLDFQTPKLASYVTVVNVYAGIEDTFRHAEEDPAGFARKGGELAGLLAPDTYKADERYIFRSASEESLFAEQCHVVERLRDLFHEMRPKYLFVAGAGVLLRTVAFAIAKNMAINCYRVLGAHHMNPGRKGRRYFFCDNDLGELSACNALFAHNSASLDSFVESFVEMLRDRTYRFDDYSKSIGRSWRMSGSTKEALTDLIRIPGVWGRGDRLSTIKLWRRFVYFARYYLQRPMFRRELDADTPFVIFPLNVPDDAQLNLRAKEWVDVEATIRLAVSNLPCGVCLVVKPHPGNPGMLSSSLIRRLRAEFPKLIFLSPDAPLLPLVKRSVGVLVVNGSIALEAAFLGKRVFHLGRYFYSTLPNCTPITTFAGFADLVANAIVTEVEVCDDAVRGLLRTYYGFTYPLINGKPLGDRSIEDTIADGISSILLGSA